MEALWIVVASRDEVRIFEAHTPQLEFNEVMDLGNPSGVLKNIDLESDKPGRSSDNRMRARHAYCTQQESRTRLLQNFYRELARQIDIAFSQQRFSQLVLVAEPRLLGIIRPLLSEQLQRVVRLELRKDITFESSEEIEERVRAAL